MRQGPRREPTGEARRNVVAEQQRHQHFAAGAARLLANRQHPRKHLHGGLARDEPQALAKFDRPPGNTIQQRGGARIMCRPATGIDRGTAAGGKPFTQFANLRPFCAGEYHAERIEQHELGMMLHR